MDATATRPTLESHELLTLLNWELAAYDECEGCHFTSIRPMGDRDDLGCNWFDARVASDHKLSTEEHFIVNHLIALTRREFDLGAH